MKMLQRCRKRLVEISLRCCWADNESREMNSFSSRTSAECQLNHQRLMSQVITLLITCKPSWFQWASSLLLTTLGPSMGLPTPLIWLFCSRWCQAKPNITSAWFTKWKQMPQGDTCNFILDSNVHFGSSSNASVWIRLEMDWKWEGIEEKNNWDGFCANSILLLFFLSSCLLYLLVVLKTTTVL